MQGLLCVLSEQSTHASKLSMVGASPAKDDFMCATRNSASPGSLLRQTSSMGPLSNLSRSTKFTMAPLLLLELLLCFEEGPFILGALGLTGGIDTIWSKLPVKSSKSSPAVPLPDIHMALSVPSSS